MSTAPLQTSLYDNHVHAGGRMVDFAGWSMPIQYTSIVEEHHCVRKALGVFDISHMGRLNISGADAVRLIDHVFTRRVVDMKPNQIRYGLVCNEAGGILDDVLVYRLSADTEATSGISHRMVVNASNREKIVAWLNEKQKRGGFDAKIADVTLETAMIAVQGPNAIQVLNPLVDVDAGSMRYYTGQVANIAGHDCYISRTGYTGEDGWELIVTAPASTAVWEIVLGAGHSAGAKPVGLGARDTLRLEAAMPLYGHELSETISPVQAGLGFALNLKDRDFIGRDAIVQFQQDTALPVRIGLALDGKRIAREGATVFCQGKPIGAVTSGTYSPTLDRPIAMAYVSPDSSQPGTQLTIDIRGKDSPATVVPLPFYSRS
ncbi:MAG: glycine cleavage system aminomethyltransferase GcvT [Pirellulales bacterium]|nr:glycine cleavage system aminomethyltransferase GcvT [Pirellulales bacterium]